MTKFGAIVYRHTKVQDAMKLMCYSETNEIAGIAVVVDEELKVLGVLTDGDIRRGLSQNLTLDSPVEEIANFYPFTLNSNLSKQQIYQRVIRHIKKDSFQHRLFKEVILVDDDRRFVDIILMSDIFDRQIDGKTIGIYGLGFVGLTLASVVADCGLLVVGIDPNQAVIETLKQGKPHFYENGLETLLGALRETNPIEFVTSNQNSDIDIHIVCVGTPINEDGQPNMQYISEASQSIALKLKRNDLVVFRSTLPVGTMRNVVLPILETSGLVGGEDFYVSFAPERTLEGKALQELRSLPQIIGGLNQISTDLTFKLFNRITENIVTVESLEAAEMVKLLNNTYRDLVFSFANEVANICDGLNLNTFKLIAAANERYPRNPIPMPSPGVGGLCLSKDPYLYTHSTTIKHYQPILGLASRKINSSGYLYVYEKIQKYCQVVNKNIAELKIFLVGLAFKGNPETSDTRESIALRLLEILPSKSNIYIKDFVVPKFDIESFGYTAIDDIEQGFIDTDAVLFMNNHYLNNRFSLETVLPSMKTSALFFDGWNMFAQKEVESINSIYYATMGYMTKR